MAINVEVAKQGAESTSSLIRRFQKKVQGSGILKRSRSIRYQLRSPSKFTKKKQALKLLERRAEYEELAKLGKLPEKKGRQ